MWSQASVVAIFRASEVTEIFKCINVFFIILFSKMADILKLDPQALNATMRKFGAPASCVKAYEHWIVLLRPQQVTLGALILAAFEPVSAFSELSPASFAELKQVTVDIENSLKQAFEYEKLNYLMLMMVDPDVHFHVIPWYSAARNFENKQFGDSGWPGPPQLGDVNETDEQMNQKILALLQENWNS